MIPRYSPADFVELWSSQRRYETWLEVELAACEAMERAGIVPEGTARKIRRKKAALDAKAIEEIEKRTKHDVIAFLTFVEESAGEPARWLHRGMTSSDVLDSALAIVMRDAADMLLERADRLLSALKKRAKEHAKLPMIGRSHGIFAEPVTFGLALAGHHAEIARGRARLEAARHEIAVGKIAGAVGTYAHLAPEIEADALASLGLKPETVSTQVVARDRHANYFTALAVLAAAIERLATNVRGWQRSEVCEAEEAFTVGQKGSSAMPHKRNPILSENLVGLARIVRAYVTPALEDVALWHERDISHSSVERMIGPDATVTLDFALARLAGVIDKLVVYPQNMRKNLDRLGGLVHSQRVLLALTQKNVAREDAYRLVQRNAMKAWADEGDLLSLLLADKDVRKHLGEAELKANFDLDFHFAQVDTIFRRVFGHA